jgi:hypothetical protein
VSTPLSFFLKKLPPPPIKLKKLREKGVKEILSPKIFTSGMPVQRQFPTVNFVLPSFLFLQKKVPD